MKIKINSKFPMSLIKLNYNCPKEEKNGEGPGSCSDSENINENVLKITEEKSKYGELLYVIRNPSGKVMSFSQNKNDMIKELPTYQKMHDKQIAKKKSGESKSISKETKNVANNLSIKKERTTSDLKNSIISKISRVPEGKNNTKVQYKLGFKHIDIVIPNGKEKVADKLIKELSELPNVFKQSPINRYVIKDKASVLDKKWGKLYGKKVTSTATQYGSDNLIVFYNGSYDRGTLVHELSHSLDNNNKLSNDQEYEKAILSDTELRTGSKFTSSYAKVAHDMYMSEGKRNMKYKEDFADGIKEFITNPERFSKLFPNRANYYKSKLFKD